MAVCFSLILFSSMVFLRNPSLPLSWSSSGNPRQIPSCRRRRLCLRLMMTLPEKRHSHHDGGRSHKLVTFVNSESPEINPDSTPLLPLPHLHLHRSELRYDLLLLYKTLTLTPSLRLRVFVRRWSEGFCSKSSLAKTKNQVQLLTEPEIKHLCSTANQIFH